MRATPPILRRVSSALCVLLCAVLFASTGSAQKLLNRKLPPNAPENDPYTEGGDPELMAAAGIVSLGGFAFSNSDTKEVDDYMATSDIRWIETKHFELGFALGTYKVSQKEKKVFLRDLTKLAERLPTVDPKAKVLDPWLRAHLYAMRMENIYTDFLSIVQLEDSVFPSGEKPWNRRGIYYGEGPHLGQKGKYEVLILPNKSTSVDFLSHNYGLKIERTQRWNIVPTDSITLVIHTQQGSLKTDSALHGHVAFNLAINFYDGLKHYSYDTPYWLREGLAHFMERRISPNHNSFDGSEGSIPIISKLKDWEGAVRKIVAKGDGPRMATLMRLKNYGMMTLTDHYCTWSMIDYLHKTNPEGFADFLKFLKGRTTADGLSDSENIPDAHRELFKEHLKMSYSAFDTAWSEWVLANY